MYLVAVLLITFFNRNLPPEFYIPLFILIPVITFLFLLIFTSFRFEINGDLLKYEMFIFGLKVLKREVKPEKIKSINFKSVGMMKKCAQIKMQKKRPSIRVSNFEPDDVYEQLLNYAKRHNHIEVTMSNDYKIIAEK